MSRPPFDDDDALPPPQPPSSLVPPLSLVPDLESMDLHMLREWLDDSFSDDDTAGDNAGDISSSSDASSDAFLQLLHQQQMSADAATAVLSMPLPSASMHSVTYTDDLVPTAVQLPLLSTQRVGGGAAAKRPRTLTTPDKHSHRRHNSVASSATSASSISRDLALLSDTDDHHSSATGRKRTWPNQREELVYLRTKVCTLENELRDLKAASRRQFSSSSTIVRVGTTGDGASASTLIACTSPGSLWEQVANRQLDEKVRAEVENRKLRDMVESQIRLAKRLQQLLRKRQVWDGLTHARPDFATDLKPEESKIYAFLSQKIHDRYATVDALFLRVGFAHIVGEVREVAMKYDDATGGTGTGSHTEHATSGYASETSGSESSRSTGGSTGELFLEMKECKLMPFDYRAADDAVWRCLKNEIITMHNTSATVVDNDENVLRAKVAVKIAGRGSEVELTVWTSWRRFSEAARVVYAVESLAITGGTSTPGAAIIQIKQSATAVIEPFTGSSAPEASIIKVYMHSTPSIIQDRNSSGGESPCAVDRHPQVGMLTDVFIASYHQNIEAMYKAIENLLLNDLLGGKQHKKPPALAR